jgi:hypothetical protein
MNRLGSVRGHWAVFLNIALTDVRGANVHIMDTPSKLIGNTDAALLGGHSTRVPVIKTAAHWIMFN